VEAIVGEKEKGYERFGSRAHTKLEF